MLVTSPLCYVIRLQPQFQPQVRAPASAVPEPGLPGLALWWIVSRQIDANNKRHHPRERERETPSNHRSNSTRPEAPPNEPSGRGQRPANLRITKRNPPAPSSPPGQRIAHHEAYRGCDASMVLVSLVPPPLLPCQTHPTRDGYLDESSSLTSRLVTPSVVISVFAIIILSILGGLFSRNHHEFMGGAGDPKDGQAVAGTLFTAVIVYAAFLVFCGCQGLLHMREDRRGAIALS
ncbi:hypothetical protein GGS23DRAFT_544991 [Durotheca rogersii]|uniref:uncharacterized protein n=1 Tax=Durotheca rogersii TaxID=419775 RepID=UPI00221FC224|nr:uncharacterized protein GGS23DRAFT_544991 [Durotheca rogersii]KAI5868331.1 hypothetical protein GGS23DRAFT_544991 [Durotheca rogersii]